MWGGGTVPHKTMNAAGKILLLLALFILTSILNTHFLAGSQASRQRKQR